MPFSPYIYYLPKNFPLKDTNFESCARNTLIEIITKDVSNSQDISRMNETHNLHSIQKLLIANE